MNDAHWHLVVNHFPIIATFFGFGILIAGIVFKNNAIKNSAYFVFITAAMFAYASMYTGEGAEEIVEDMPNIGHQIIHEHEELAEKLAILLYVLGGFSALGLFLNNKKHGKSNLVSYLTAFVAIGAIYVAVLVGNSGGEIRHTEIRENAFQKPLIVEDKEVQLKSEEKE